MAVRRTAYLSLGSNLGDRLGNLAAAVARLGAFGQVWDVETSGVYETEPWGRTDQPKFLNCVVRLSTSLDPFSLLAAVLGIEQALGRVRTGRVEDKWGPRVIDVDILLLGDLVTNTPILTIPHPRMWERAFVLVPLLDLAPEMRSPSGATIRELVADLPDRDGVVRVRSNLQGVSGRTENSLN
ncbi:MAG: 2-amino-4-hydroxy-6-hydroxymethyldihydropteridine diphosphokinase [Firmicutes bacterium]|jgi:2-amino-4-hydroxy-6-hydroxymethyldihydropteridine diphosphokinase|nr:2-amino-4-hydroxy-6-hydroxymethyldihydropteridine diphosphokinase [Bacillota bacterium]